MAFPIVEIYHRWKGFVPKGDDSSYHATEEWYLNHTKVSHAECEGKEYHGHIRVNGIVHHHYRE